MTMFKSIVAAAAAVVAIAAVPAQAIVNIGNFTQTGNKPIIRWLNNGGNSTATTGGSIFTINAAGNPGTAAGQFSFTIPLIAPYLTNVAANFTLFGQTPAGTPALRTAFAGFEFLTQPNISGSFAITTQNAISTPYGNFAAGSCLLCINAYTGALIVGQRGGTSAAFAASTAGGSGLTFFSDFYDFSNTTERDFSFSLTGITPTFNAAPFTTGSTPTRALRTFVASSTGSFSADVPEPQTWALLISGFAMVGFAMRRRTATVAA